MADRAGEIVGCFLVVERAGSYPKGVLYLIRCKCGAESVVRSCNITAATACSKCRVGDWTGRTFGQLTVTSRNRHGAERLRG